MNCLVVDENKRMCLEDILSHSWFDYKSCQDSSLTKYSHELIEDENVSNISIEHGNCVLNCDKDVNTDNITPNLENSRTSPWSWLKSLKKFRTKFYSFFNNLKKNSKNLILKTCS